MWNHLALRKRIVFALVPFVLAIGLVLQHEVGVHRELEARQDPAAQFHNLTRLMTLRMSRKADELQAEGVKPPELERLLDEEQEQTRLEANRVLASHYSKNFDMKSHDAVPPEASLPRAGK